MKNAIKIDVTFPVSGKTRTFRSVRAVSRMLSGNGTASGGLRETINRKAVWGGIVRNNEVIDAAAVQF